MLVSVCHNLFLNDKLVQYGLIVNQELTTDERLVIIDQFTGDVVLDLRSVKISNEPILLTEEL